MPSSLWETSAVLLVDGAQAVAIDPCISQAEIEAVRARAEDEGATVVAVLATHADWDHVAGIAAFPEAEAAMGPLAAGKVASGAALADMRGEGAALGLAWPGAPRCDRVLRPGRCEQVGPFAIETLALPGHTDCGIGFRLRAPDTFVVGDYLSPIEYPYVYFSTAAYRGTLTALIDLLDHDAPETVVPGHGGPLGPAEARTIAVSDLAYLHALREAVAASLGRGEGREQAVDAGYAVPPPRSLPVDEAETRRNAELQLEELAAC
jgi:glyoxylase-like metal-dependent hydrolase (beta-lactamase superfamily II)